jgi:hypothetical protein
MQQLPEEVQAVHYQGTDCHCYGPRPEGQGHREKITKCRIVRTAGLCELIAAEGYDVMLLPVVWEVLGHL